MDNKFYIVSGSGDIRTINSELERAASGTVSIEWVRGAFMTQCTKVVETGSTRPTRTILTSVSSDKYADERTNSSKVATSRDSNAASNLDCLSQSSCRTAARSWSFIVAVMILNAVPRSEKSVEVKPLPAPMEPS